MELSRGRRMHGLARVFTAGFVVPLGLAIIWAAPCFAQFNPGGAGGGLGGATQRSVKGSQRGDQQTKPDVQPPVLPGTKTAPEAAAPTVSPADMTPTEALFDAINRGDLAGARDAMNRGADSHALNVLGLTPLELSVDLGRNDISFMLLSMREDDAASRATARNGVDLKGADRGGVLRAGATPRAVSRARAAAISADASEDTVVETPRLYSGGGGAPIPAAGFLGFDGGRAAR